VNAICHPRNGPLWSVVLIVVAVVLVAIVVGVVEAPEQVKACVGLEPVHFKRAQRGFDPHRGTPL
jgi:hypothetical protein